MARLAHHLRRGTRCAHALMDDAGGPAARRVRRPSWRSTMTFRFRRRHRQLHRSRCRSSQRSSSARQCYRLVGRAFRTHHGHGGGGGGGGVVLMIAVLFVGRRLRVERFGAVRCPQFEDAATPQLARGDTPHHGSGVPGVRPLGARAHDSRAGWGLDAIGSE